MAGPAHRLTEPAQAWTLANSQGPVAAVTLAEAARFWARLGMVSFGGPAAQIALLLWLHQSLAWSWLNCALALAGLDLALSGLFLRIGGGMLKAPFLPETRLGITRTTRALTGRF